MTRNLRSRFIISGLSSIVVAAVVIVAAGQVQAQTFYKVGSITTGYAPEVQSHQGQTWLFYADSASQKIAYTTNAGNTANWGSWSAPQQIPGDETFWGTPGVASIDDQILHVFARRRSDNQMMRTSLKDGVWDTWKLMHPAITVRSSTGVTAAYDPDRRALFVYCQDTNGRVRGTVSGGADYRDPGFWAWEETSNHPVKPGTTPDAVKDKVAYTVTSPVGDEVVTSHNFNGAYATGARTSHGPALVRYLNPVVYSRASDGSIWLTTNKNSWDSPWYPSTWNSPSRVGAGTPTLGQLTATVILTPSWPGIILCARGTDNGVYCNY